MEEKICKVAINERGCIFPTITIEDEGKVSKCKINDQFNSKDTLKESHLSYRIKCIIID